MQIDWKRWSIYAAILLIIVLICIYWVEIKDVLNVIITIIKMA